MCVQALYVTAFCYFLLFWAQRCLIGCFLQKQQISHDCKISFFQITLFVETFVSCNAGELAVGICFAFVTAVFSGEDVPWSVVIAPVQQASF